MSNTFLIFGVGEHFCGIPVDAVREIVHLPATSQVPGQPSVLHGFMNLRGHVVPVVSMRTLFDSTVRDVSLYAPAIIVAVSGTQIALLVDSVNDVLTVERSALEPLGDNHSFNDCADAQFQTTGGPVTALSPERLLLAKERECIASLQVQLEHRSAEAEGLRG